jgi:hypothetical protein
MDIVELRVKGGLQLNKWLLINTVNWNTIFLSFKAYRLYISCTLPKKFEFVETLLSGVTLVTPV